MPRIVFTLKFGLKLKVWRSRSFRYRNSGFSNGHTSYVIRIQWILLAILGWDLHISEAFLERWPNFFPFFPCLWMLKPMNGGKFINEINFVWLFHVSSSYVNTEAKWVVNYAHKMQQSVVSFDFNAFTVAPHSCFDWLTKNYLLWIRFAY